MLDRFAQPPKGDRQPFPSGTSPIENRASYCNRSVWFATTDADQLLLQTIDHLLEAGDYSSFSELCKQALRAWLLPDEPQKDATLVVLQQQIVTLQLQVNQLSQQLAQSPDPVASLAAIEAQITALTERIADLEQAPSPAQSLERTREFPKMAAPTLSPKAISVGETGETSVRETSAKEADPLLDRLVALLEDF